MDMALGKREPKQKPLWVASDDIAEPPGHRFYERLNEVLDEIDFDRRAEELCAPYYEPAGTPGRPSLPPGVYFRMLFIGYFEGIESERGIAWRCADSLSLRAFLGYGPTEKTPDHSTLSRTRQRLPASVYEEIFQLVLALMKEKGLIKGERLAVDSTDLLADASMKSLVRRDTGESYREYVGRLLTEEEGVEDPDPKEVKRFDKKRKNRSTSNKDWTSTTDPDARVKKLQDGRTRLAYKDEHVTDLETGALLEARICHADQGDTKTIEESLEQAEEHAEAAKKPGASEDSEDAEEPASDAFFTSGFVELVADKGYHQTQLLRRLRDKGYRTYIPEQGGYTGRRRWTDKGGEPTKQAYYLNRARTERSKGKALQRRRAEVVERTFAHACETGGLRRMRLRGLENINKRYKAHAAAFNLGVLMRTLFERGTPRGLAEASNDLFELLLWPVMAIATACSRLSAEIHRFWTKRRRMIAG